MNVTTVAPPKAAPAARPKATERPVPERVRAFSREELRWIAGLMPPFLAAAVFFGLSVATDTEWPLGPAIVLGPILMMFAFIYLCISSDSNGTLPPR